MRGPGPTPPCAAPRPSGRRRSRARARRCARFVRGGHRTGRARTRTCRSAEGYDSRGTRPGTARRSVGGSSSPSSATCRLAGPWQFSQPTSRSARRGDRRAAGLAKAGDVARHAARSTPCRRNHVAKARPRRRAPEACAAPWQRARVALTQLATPAGSGTGWPSARAGARVMRAISSSAASGATWASQRERSSDTSRHVKARRPRWSPPRRDPRAASPPRRAWPRRTASRATGEQRFELRRREALGCPRRRSSRRAAPARSRRHAAADPPARRPTRPDALGIGRARRRPWFTTIHGPRRASARAASRPPASTIGAGGSSTRPRRPRCAR